jgi:hypothetical protein
MRTALRSLVLALALLAPAMTTAQQPGAAAGEIGGVVYDSVARAPLSGAIVQVVALATPSIAFSTRTDDRGRYAIPGVPPGRYVIGFLHIGLDSLALEPPLRSIDVRGGERTRVDLSVPSPARIVETICRATPRDSTGLVLGLLRDARTGSPLERGNIAAQWNELVIDSDGLHRFDRSAAGAVGSEGWFIICGVPAGGDIVVTATSGADSSGQAMVSVPVAGLVRRDLWLGGRARVTGVVTSEKNLPIPNARVGFVGAERVAVTDSTGAFRLDATPAGTQTMEVRALGYSPELRPLVLSIRDTTIAIRLTSVARVMDTIRVLSRRVYNRDTYGFERRKRMGNGRYFDEATVRSRRPVSIYQLLSDIPTMRVIQEGGQRTILMRGGSAMGSSRCVPDLFINGMRMPRDLVGELDLLVRPQELAGMEVYRSQQVPAEFSGFQGCGAIVIWTRVPVGGR